MALWRRTEALDEIFVGIGLVELDHLAANIERRGVSFAKYLELYNAKSKKIPMYRVQTGEGTQYVADDEALAAVVKKLEKTKQGGIDVAEGEKKKMTSSGFDIVEFYEADDIAEKVHALTRLGFEVHEIAPKEEELEERYVPRAKRSRARRTQKSRVKKSDAKQFPFMLTDGKAEYYHESLLEVLSWIKTEGRKGITIQRYKGLGEMNPEQLWETTMNPGTRTLLKVTMEDAVKADEMFSVLMGDEVEGRRDFIQKHAREVKNLDI